MSEEVIKIQLGLTPGQLCAIHEAAKCPIVYDQDCYKFPHELIERYKKRDPDVFVR